MERSDRLATPARLAGLAAAVALLIAACSAGSAAVATSAPPASAAAGQAAASGAPVAAGGYGRYGSGSGYGSGAPTPAPSAAVSSGTSGTIVDYAFKPATLTVTVGTTVTWTNTGSAAHTVTADDGSFGSGTLQGGATFRQTFSKAGTYAYHCSIHSSMTATVVVTS